MIKKVTDKIDLSGVSSPLLPLIYCDYKFSSGDLNGVYFQYDEADILTSVFSLKNSCVTLVKVENPDFSELSVFFEFTGVVEVLSDCRFLPTDKKLLLMKTKTRYEAVSQVKALNESSKMKDYLGVYNLLNEGDGDFSDWYTSFSKKINSSVSLGVYKVSDDTVVSTATVTAVYDNSAILSGVFTNPMFRGKGYASDCVKTLINELYNQGVSEAYLWCKEDNMPFYQKLGFDICGGIYLSEVK